VSRLVSLPARRLLSPGLGLGLGLGGGGAKRRGGGGGGSTFALPFDEQFPDASTDALVARLTSGDGGRYNIAGGEFSSSNLGLITRDAVITYNGNPMARFPAGSPTNSTLITAGLARGRAAVYQKATFQFPVGMLDAYIANASTPGFTENNQEIQLLSAAYPTAFGGGTLFVPVFQYYLLPVSDPAAWTNPKVVGNVDASDFIGGPTAPSGDSILFADFFGVPWEVIMLPEMKYDPGTSTSSVRVRGGIRPAGTTDALSLLADASASGLTDPINGGGFKGFGAFALSPVLYNGGGEDTSLEFSDIARWQVIDAVDGDVWSTGLTPDPDSSVAPS
jgi:hypothetical protein